MFWAGKHSFKENFRSLFPKRKQALSFSVPSLPDQCREEIQAKLQSWVRQKGYRQPAQTPMEVASSIDIPYSLLYRYFQDRQEDFRSWRSRLRLQEALQLMEAHPSLPISAISRMAGFSDRSNFSHVFKQSVGLTPGQWKNKLKNCK
jgi:AraC-like DNA-binding protein